MKEKLCFILFVCCIICNAENNSRVFGEILKVDNSTYIEVDFPYNSTYNIDSSGINLSYGSFELYIHYSKHTKDSHDFFFKSFLKSSIILLKMLCIRQLSISLSSIGATGEDSEQICC